MIGMSSVRIRVGVFFFACLLGVLFGNAAVTITLTPTITPIPSPLVGAALGATIGFMLGLLIARFWRAILALDVLGGIGFGVSTSFTKVINLVLVTWSFLVSCILGFSPSFSVVPSCCEILSPRSILLR